MTRYILKRLLYIIFVAFIVSIILFFVYKSIPGNPARNMVDPAIALTNYDLYVALIKAAEKELGLDKSLFHQYIGWITKLLKGDFGYSTIHRVKVTSLVAVPLRNTVKLNIISLFLVFGITIPLGITTAVRKYTMYDNVVQVGSVIGMSIPSFFIALLAIFLFSVKLHIFPVSGTSSPKIVLENMNTFERILDNLKYMALPLLVMTISSLAGITRYVRGAMVDILQQDYIRTARSKGLSEKVVIYSHAFRNALIPVVTILTGWLVGVFGGSIIIETIFGWNGIGKLLYDSLRQQDYQVILTMNMFYTVLTLVGNLLMDLSYLVVDPRVKLG